MRCVECSAKQKGEPEQFKFRCPSCGHQVAASKKRDGLADGAIKTALEAVTGNGTFKILPEHLGYELLRRGVSRADKRKKLLPIGLVLLVGGAFVFPFGGFVLVIVAIVMLLKWGVRKRLIPRDPFASAHRFLTINPSDRVLGEDDTFTPGDAERELADTAEQIVICQHARYARFLLANDVHPVSYTHLTLPTSG